MYKLKKDASNSIINIDKIDGYNILEKVNIDDFCVNNITLYDEEVIRNYVTESVFLKYQKLITIVTDLLVQDEDDGQCIRHALDLIEKFRLEIKEKYRKYLEKEDLKQMGEQLKKMKKVADNRYLEVINNYKTNSINRQK